MALVADRRFADRSGRGSPFHSLGLVVTRKNEDFIHFDTCIDRLQSAWTTLTMIKANLGHPLVGLAFRFALVEYATPYNRSDGVQNTRYRLDESHVPKDSLELHRRLLSSRSRIQAHADLTVLDAEVSYTELRGERLVSVSQNIITGLEELQSLDAIIRLVELTLRSMSEDRDRRKLKLEP